MKTVIANANIRLKTIDIYDISDLAKLKFKYGKNNYIDVSRLYFLYGQTKSIYFVILG